MLSSVVRKVARPSVVRTGKKRNKFTVVAADSTNIVRCIGHGHLPMGTGVLLVPTCSTEPYVFPERRANGVIRGCRPIGSKIKDGQER
jgi:hypothetical protein